MHLVPLHQVVFKHFPEGREVICSDHFDACFLSSSKAATSVFSPTQILLVEDDGTYIARGDAGLADPEQGIQVFF